MSANVETGGRKVDGISSLRIEQVTGGVENSPDGVQAVEITVEEQSTPTSVQGRSVESDERGDSDEDDTEPSVLQALSSEQLARRASFKKILDDLSSADQNLKTHDPFAVAAAATLQAQAQQVALQQAAAVAAAGGLTNSTLIPGLMQHIATVAPPSSSSGSGESQLPAQLSVMLPSHQQIQSAILSATSLGTTQSPLLAGAMQSLANQTIPASLLSSALLNASMAATLSSTTSSASAAGIPGSNATITSPSSVSPKSGQVGLASPGVQQVLDETTKKREVRLMKNREAARECRRKKKEYVRCLENRVSVLESQNQALIGELRALKELYLPKSSQE